MNSKPGPISLARFGQHTLEMRPRGESLSSLTNEGQAVMTMMMSKAFIALVLMAGLLFFPKPAVNLVVIKGCCCVSQGLDCPHRSDGKADCPHRISISIPSVAGFAAADDFIHPAAARSLLNWRRDYATRSEAPLLPPPKAA